MPDLEDPSHRAFLHSEERNTSNCSHNTQIYITCALIYIISEWLRLESVSWRTFSASPCSTQGQPQRVAQGHIQQGFEHLLGWRATSV